MFKEFKEFISKGNVMDMAVGLVTGSAFTAIVTSLVNDVIMPCVGVLVGGVDFTDLKIVLKAASGEAEAVTLNYGNFIQAVVNFLIVAFVIFLVVKAMNKMRAAAEKLAKKEEEEKAEAPAEPPADIALLTEIRDLLKKE
ncbi:MAG: large-conductance mechanosensitive channel protein MscL [Firmicutes bacterium]|nr:large-conductance mechanosensitive channel protein MscL [Bacillota bacterium]MBR0480865.1 large-conductance mechanosensitive channel protein MscL [Bacillota bacterium]